APIAVAWALDPAAKLAEPVPFVQESRDYWRDVDERELRAGVALPLSAPGAVIRLSPHASNGGAELSRADLVVVGSGNHLQGEILQAAADTEALRAAGMDVPAGTLAVTLDEGYAAPTITLAAPNATGAWLVHVHEKQSTVAL